MQEFTIAWIFGSLGALMLMFGVTIMCINGISQNLIFISLGGFILSLIGVLINWAIIRYKKKTKNTDKLN